MPDGLHNADMCPVCSLEVLEIGAQCDDCKFWIHQHCAGLTNVQYSRLTLSKKLWRCPSCILRRAKCTRKNTHRTIGTQATDPSLHSLQQDILELKAELAQEKSDNPIW